MKNLIRLSEEIQINKLFIIRKWADNHYKIELVDILKKRLAQTICEELNELLSETIKNQLKLE